MTKRTVIEEDDSQERAAEVAELAQLNADEDGALFRISDELRQTAGVTAMIVCLAPAEKEGYVADLPIQEFSVARLKRLYGPGRYKIRLQGPKGFIAGGGTIKIADVSSDATVIPLDTERERREQKAEARIDKLWEIALASVPAVITAMMNRPQGTDVAALVTALKPAPGPSLADLSTAMVNMRTLTAPEKSDSKVDEILKVFEVAQNLSGGNDSKSSGSSSWLDVIRDLIKVAPEALKPVLEARVAAMQSSQPVTQIQPAIASATIPQPFAPSQAQPTEPTATTVAPSTSSDDMLKLMMPVIREHLTKVAGWAEKNRDPQIYCDVFVDELPDNIGSYIPHEKVMEYLNWPTWFEIVTEHEPRLKEHREWCDEFRLALIEILKELNEPTEESETPTNSNDGALPNET